MFTIIPIIKSSINIVLPTVTTTSESSVTFNSALLGGDVTSDGGATVTERGIVYSLTSVNSNPTIGGSGVTKDINGSGTGLFSETISGLSGSSNYSFRAYAINSEGTSYGSVDTFTTGVSPSLTAFDLTQDNYSTSGAACAAAGVGDTGEYYHDGVGTYPADNDTVYNDIGATTEFNGGDLWFYINIENNSIQINSIGICSNKTSC